MNFVESIMTQNPCYTEGRKITVKGLMLHSVGCAQPRAMAFINSWNTPSHDSSCVHGFIDGNDGTVYQTLPWNHRGWHAGGAANNTHIGVEMCEPASLNYTSGATFTCSNIPEARKSVKRTYEAAVELFAMLCKLFYLDPLGDGVIVSHNEGHIRGIASNHSDPEHLWNQLETGYTMDGFRKAVKELLDKGVADFPNGGNTEEAYPYAGPAGTYPTVPFSVKVLIDNLNIRANPNFGGTIKGQTGRGVFTVVEVQNGWGKLRNGTGWIYLEEKAYCTVLDRLISESYERKSIDEIAREVVNGKWGNGEERKMRLTEAGYDYNVVQQRVNEIIWNP